MREFVLENDHLRLNVLPELGGKIGSLLGLRDGREHLLQPPERERRPAEYGAPFDQYDGLMSDPAQFANSLGININRDWGAVMVAFGCAMLAWARLTPEKDSESDAVEEAAW